MRKVNPFDKMHTTPWIYSVDEPEKEIWVKPNYKTQGERLLARLVKLYPAQYTGWTVEELPF